MLIAHYQRPAKHPQQAGFSLIEVLIAFLVLSIGMLGVASLQVNSARYIHEAKMRTTAAISVNEIVNRIQATAYDMNGTARDTLLNLYVGATPASTCVPNLSSIENDLACLGHTISSQLPNGSYTLTSMGARTLRIRVSWFNRDLQASANTDWDIRF